MTPVSFGLSDQSFIIFDGTEPNPVDSGTISGDVGFVSTPESSAIVMLLAGIAASAFMFLLKKHA